MDKCFVTVYCTVYNHAKYLRRTLEGFINQKTEFPFKVIVHDDASTDGSDEILREFANKYPEIIVPIFQEQNQYSLHVPIFKEFIRPLITSPYTAICEGDDYWNDEFKLQKQFDYMEDNPDCSLCVHNTVFIREDGMITSKVFNECKNDRDYTTEEIIESGGGGLFHTSSFFYRTEIRDQMPDDFFINGVGDYPLAIWFSMNGIVHYIDCVMSAFRMSSMGSYSYRKLKDRNFKIKCEQDMIDGIHRLNRVSNYQYCHSFKKVIKKHEYRMLLMRKSYISIFTKPRYWSLIMETIVHRFRS